MRVFAKLSLVEMKLFLREPMTALFAFALPLTVLFVLGGVFGNQADVGIYRGVGAMDYYIPAYVAFVSASVGLISVPTHIASNRERGVLKRYHASGVSPWSLVGSQVAVMFVIAAVSAMILVMAAAPVYDVSAPDSVPMVVLGFVLVSLSFAGLGVLLGAVMPSSRAAQALGVLLWFVLLMVGGGGPPPEVLTGAMSAIGDVTPLRHAIHVMQDGWLSLDPGSSWWVLAAIALLFGLAAVRFFRWE
jgi:ABC-2 type transport system permease protein